MEDWLEFFGIIGIVLLLVFAAIMIVCVMPMAIDWAKTLFVSDYWTRVSVATVAFGMAVFTAILVGIALHLLLDCL